MRAETKKEVIRNIRSDFWSKFSSDGLVDHAIVDKALAFSLPQPFNF